MRANEETKEEETREQRDPTKEKTHRRTQNLQRINTKTKKRES
jgi:hypothetical protein